MPEKLLRASLTCYMYIYLNALDLAVLSVRFEVGVSLLLAPAGANKRGPFSSWGVSGYAPPENFLNQEARKHDFQ